MRTPIARPVVLSAVSLAFGTAMSSAPASADESVPFGVRAAPLPTQQSLDKTSEPRPPSEAGAAKSNTFFLNYDGVSIQFTGQEDDSSQNISQFQEFQGNYAPYGGGAKRAASFQAVQVDWAAYDVNITDQRPAGSYTMCVNSPTNPFGGGVLGIAPLDCNDQQGRNIVFAYHSDSDEFPAATQATTMSQEIAHAYGLEHVSQPNDIMNPFNSGGDPSFLDQCLTLVDANGGTQDILCNGQHNMFCGGGGQNSHQELLWLFGASAPDTTPPSVQITSPADGALFDAGASFSITANASDDQGIASVDLFNNGELLQTDSTEPYQWDVQSIPVGNYCLKATAHDNAGNQADSNEVCIQVANATTSGDTTDPPATTDPPDPPGDSDSDGDSLGEDTGTGSNADDDAGGSEPTTNFGGSLPGLPPDFGEDDDKGTCECDTSAPVPTASLLGLALLGLARRRRR